MQQKTLKRLFKTYPTIKEKYVLDEKTNRKYQRKHTITQNEMDIIELKNKIIEMKYLSEALTRN